MEQQAQRRGHHKHAQQRGVVIESGYQRQERVAQKQQYKSRQQRNQRCSQHLGISYLPIQAEADHRIGNAKGDQRHQQIGALLKQVRSTVLRIRQHMGIQRHQEKHQQFGAEGADGKNQCIGKKPFVFIHSHSPSSEFFAAETWLSQPLKEFLFEKLRQALP